MSRSDETEDPRRRELIKALTLGLFAGALPAGRASAWSLFGDKPEPMPKGKSIYRLRGDVGVNDKNADENTIIKPGDQIITGDDSEIIFVVGGQSMIMRSNSQLKIEGSGDSVLDWVIHGLNLLSGKLLSVSREQTMKVRTTTATIGIRGTGWYAEADPEQTYFCTCYGTTEIVSNKDRSTQTVTSEHHDVPLYILGDQEKGESIRSAPFINHTDEELMLIESLVGRTPPFVFPKDDYSGPRRGY